MRASTLTRSIIGACLVLALVVMHFAPDNVGVSYASVDGISTYRADSDLVSLLLSPMLVVLYIWVLRLPAVEGANFVTAGLWRRFWSFLVDLLFAMLIAIPWAGLIALVIEAARTGHFVWSVQRQPALDGDGWVAFGTVLPSMIWFLMYFVMPQRLLRASPGSVLLGIQVRYDTGRPSLRRAIGRTMLSFVALAGCYISAPMALANPEKRMWQDKAVDSRVVQWTD